MNPTTSDKLSVYDVCSFLAHYSAWLLGCGATCIRLENNINRMAAKFGMCVQATIMPRHVNVSVSRIGNDCDCATVIAAVAQTPISFEMNTRLSELSWAVADGKLNFRQARHRFEAIRRDKHYNANLTLLLASFANAAFCRLFGGDFAAMAVVFVATAVGFMLKQQLTARKVDGRIVVIICAFVSTILGATASLFSLGNTPAIAIGASVLYLVPGIPFLNSFSDMLYRHYICAFGRFMDACVLTGCLSVGLCLGMLLMGAPMF